MQEHSSAQRYAQSDAPPADRRPRYRRILEFLRSQIASGKYAVGDCLPTELELQHRFGVSRATVRTAIRVLVQEGLVRPRQGVGTVVLRSRPPVEPSRLRGFTEDLARRGVPTEARVRSAAIVEPPPHVRDRLEVPAGERVLHLVRLRFVAGTPLALMHNYVPASLGIGPEEDFTGPLYALVERDPKHYITYGRDAIGAAAADAEAAGALDLPLGAPVLTLKRTAFVAFDRPIEYVEAAVRPDLYEYNVTLLRGKEPT